MWAAASRPQIVETIATQEDGLRDLSTWRPICTRDWWTGRGWAPERVEAWLAARIRGLLRHPESG
jgi:hypothetical protein